MNSKMKLVSLGIIGVAFLLCISGAQGQEIGIDRPGKDYKSFSQTVPETVSGLCTKTCNDDLKCRAYTYDINAKTCWLKFGVPAVVKKDSCVSGVKAMEYDTDRGGSDYKNFDLAQADPALCQTSCSGEAQCKAWTYVQPGIQGPNARCWLKSTVPAAKPNAYCVSGVKAMEYDTDRGGSDYKNFDLAQADPGLCQTSCSGEAQCKAWTYVQPGIQGPNARCWLKSTVPAAKPNACCVSGVKG